MKKIKSLLLAVMAFVSIAQAQIDILNPTAGLYRGTPYLTTWSQEWLTNQSTLSAANFWFKDTNTVGIFQNAISTNFQTTLNGISNQIVTMTGMSNNLDVWIGQNTNTLNIGTIMQPYDGSTPAKLTQVFARFSDGNTNSYTNPMLRITVPNVTFHLLPGTYQLQQVGLWIANGDRFIGGGADSTVLRSGSTNGATSQSFSFAVIGDYNAMFGNHTASISGEQVQDLTLDCNGYSGVTNSVNGVVLSGCNAAIRNVVVTNISCYSPNGNYVEIWGAMIVGPAGASTTSDATNYPSHNNIVENSRVYGAWMGHSGSGTGNVDGISIGLGTTSNTPILPNAGGIIRNNLINFNNYTGDANVNYFFCINGTQGLLVEHNVATAPYGAGFYTEGFLQDVTIRDNVFIITNPIGAVIYPYAYGGGSGAANNLTIDNNVLATSYGSVNTFVLVPTVTNLTMVNNKMFYLDNLNAPTSKELVIYSFNGMPSFGYVSGNFIQATNTSTDLGGGGGVLSWLSDTTLAGVVGNLSCRTSGGTYSLAIGGGGSQTTIATNNSIAINILGGGAYAIGAYQSALSMFGAAPTTNAIAIGVNSYAYSSGLAIGTGNARAGNGIAIGNNANADSFGIVIGHAGTIAQSATNHGIIIGDGSGNGDSWADNNGIAIGDRCYAGNSGTAVGGLNVSATNFGCAFGQQSIGDSYGFAGGYLADGHYYGAASGNTCNGSSNGVAIGNSSNGRNWGVSIGSGSTGSYTNIAIGYNANANPGGTFMNTVQIGTGSSISNGWFHFNSMPLVGPQGQATLTNLTVSAIATAKQFATTGTNYGTFSARYFTNTLGYNVFVCMSGQTACAVLNASNSVVVPLAVNPANFSLPTGAYTTNSAGTGYYYAQ